MTAPWLAPQGQLSSRPKGLSPRCAHVWRRAATTRLRRVHKTGTHVQHGMNGGACRAFWHLRTARMTGCIGANRASHPTQSHSTNARAGNHATGSTANQRREQRKGTQGDALQHARNKQHGWERGSPQTGAERWGRVSVLARHGPEVGAGAQGRAGAPQPPGGESHTREHDSAEPGGGGGEGDHGRKCEMRDTTAAATARETG